MKRKTLNDMSEFMTSGDLVELGIYLDEEAVYQARRRGTSPDYVKIGHRVLYQKKSVLEFLEKNLRKGTPILSGEATDE